MRGFPIRFLLLLLAVAATGLQAASAPKVTFYQNIAPVIYQNCSSCHRPGESGPFPLLSYDDVKKHAAQIADVTQRRYMPPWLPESGYGEFAEERRLTDAQIQLIQEWVKQGALPGPAAHAPQPPRFTSEWALGTPDLVLHIAKPYQLGADGPEVFWNFVVPVLIVAGFAWIGVIATINGTVQSFLPVSVRYQKSR